MPDLSTPESTTPPPATPLPNSIEARTTEGEIKDQGAPLPPPAEAKPTPEVPEAYSDFTLPKDLSFDPKVMDGAKAIFKELGLSQEAAQKLISFQAERELAGRDSNIRAMEDMRIKWRDEVTKDPVIGPKLNEVLAEVAKAKNLLDPQVREKFNEALNITGAGDHPGILRAFYDLALKVNEGKHVTGTGPSEVGQQKPGTASRPSAAQSLYPNLPSGARAP